MVPDGRTDGMDGQTQGRRQNYIPPTSSGIKTNSFTMIISLKVSFLAYLSSSGGIRHLDFKNVVANKFVLTEMMIIAIW